MILYFIRHGQAGLADVSRDKKLTTLGKRQAVKIGKRLSKKKFNLIYISNFSRTIETFNAMKEHLKYDKCIISSDYAEVYGGVVGNPRPKILKTIKKEERDKKISEMTKEGLKRVNKFFNEIIKMPLNSRALLIGHGNFFRTLIAKTLKINSDKTWHIRVNNGSMSILAISKGGKSCDVVLINDLNHLKKDEHSQNL